MTKIKDFKENDKIQQPLLVQSYTRGIASNGAPYLSIVLQDNSGTIDGKFWSVKPEDEALVANGKVLNVLAGVNLYNKALQLKITKVSEVEGEVNMDDYLVSSSYSMEERKAEVDRLINSIENETYKTLVIGMLEKVKEKFYEYPAASKIHHNFLGGLSEHSVSMAQMAEEIVKHYPQLNHDLLISGALVHDMGKTAEMSGAVSTEYTLEGKLEGHISIANGWLSEIVHEKGLEDKEEAILLHHMILSHHGQYEFGSPVLPLVQEAEVLCIIDNLDARLNALKQALDGVKPGNFTQRLFALDNRQFYKPKG